MSWKSIVITGLLCVVASPVLAAPTLSIDLVRSGGLPVLDASGNWQWSVSVSPDAALFADNPPNGTGGSLAMELALAFSGAPIVGAPVVNTTNFPANNPASAIPGFAFWGAADSGVKVSGNQIVAALGSTYFTTGGAKEAFIVKTAGPSTVGPNLTTGVAWSGAYTGNARIAQAGQNFDTFSGSLSKSVLGGDANLNGTVNIGDFGILQANFGGSGKIWTQGDFNKTGSVNIGDFGILQASFGQSVPAPGGGSISVVPEPATLGMLVMAVCAMTGCIRRRG
ncbi:MAG: PEP-CTERM sorting domain-containing protein [Pirellulales bacterium]